MFANALNSEKKLSWVLTLIISVLLSLESIFSLPLVASSARNFHEFALSDSDRSALITDMFVAFCATELLIGTYCYFSQLKPLEGYFHHSFYIVMLASFRYFKVSNCFWIFSWCEIPTMIMSLRKLGLKLPPSFFSVSFIATRVVLFSWTLVRFFMDLPAAYWISTFPPAALIWTLHVWWGKKLI